MTLKLKMIAMLTAITASASLAIAMEVSTQSAVEDLLAGKPVHTLGPAKTWTADGQSFTVNVEDLQKLTAQPKNTSNVYLYPENGALNTPENQTQVGIQGFYVDMEKVQNVGTVSTTWEGAAADSYEIYLTDEEPTLSILDTTPTYVATGLGQYTENTASLPAGSKGRYLVFQPTNATNWGWGVKIRSISATAPFIAELSTVSVSPNLLLLNEATPLTLEAKDQVGMAIDSEAYEVSVSSNATYEDGKLTIHSGSYALVTFTMDGKSIDTKVYAVTSDPGAPNPADIAAVIYSNPVTDANNTAVWTTAYNGGATKLGEFTFPNGEVAMGFADTRCVFMSNDKLGAWDANLNPKENGWGTFNVDIYGTEDVEGTMQIERAGFPGNVAASITLRAGEWNHVVVDVRDVTVMHTISIRFDEANASTILISDVYFTPVDVNDTTAPELEDVKATAGFTSVTFHLYATDNVAPEVTYIIKEGDNTYETSGLQSEPTDFTINGLDFGTEYTFTVVANDGTNNSEEQTITVSTLGLEKPAETGIPNGIFIPSFTVDGDKTTVPEFTGEADSEMTVLSNQAGQSLLSFSNFTSGILSFSPLDVKENTVLHVEIYSTSAGQITFDAVWGDGGEAAADEPLEDAGYAEYRARQFRAFSDGKTVDVEADKWNSYDVNLYYFGYADEDRSDYTVSGLKMSSPDLSSFNLGNTYFVKNDNSPVSVEENMVEVDTADVYTVQGICVARGINIAEVSALPAGLYIVKTGLKTSKLLIK